MFRRRKRPLVLSRSFRGARKKFCVYVVLSISKSMRRLGGLKPCLSDAYMLLKKRTHEIPRYGTKNPVVGHWQKPPKQLRGIVVAQKQ